MIAVLNWLLNHWYVWFWLWALGLFEGVRDFFAGIGTAILEFGGQRHERKLELARVRAAAPVAEVVSAPKPGRCVHRRVKQVRDRDDDLVGWLCTGCDAQLPADWAVAREDL